MFFFMKDITKCYQGLEDKHAHQLLSRVTILNESIHNAHTIKIHMIGGQKNCVERIHHRERKTGVYSLVHTIENISKY